MRPRSALLDHEKPAQAASAASGFKSFASMHEGGRGASEHWTSRQQCRHLQDGRCSSGRCTACNSLRAIGRHSVRAGCPIAAQAAPCDPRKRSGPQRIDSTHLARALCSVIEYTAPVWPRARVQACSAAAESIQLLVTGRPAFLRRPKTTSQRKASTPLRSPTILRLAGHSGHPGQPASVAGGAQPTALADWQRRYLSSCTGEAGVPASPGSW